MMCDSDLVSFIQVGSTADEFPDYFQVSSFGSKHEGSVASLLKGTRTLQLVKVLVPNYIHVALH